MLYMIRLYCLIVLVVLGVCLWHFPLITSVAWCLLSWWGYYDCIKNDPPKWLLFKLVIAPFMLVLLHIWVLFGAGPIA